MNGSHQEETNHNCCFTFTNGTLLPLQIMFQGTTNHSLPPMNEGKITCSSFGFHLTFSSNH